MKEKKEKHKYVQYLGKKLLVVLTNQVEFRGTIVSWNDYDDLVLQVKFTEEPVIYRDLKIKRSEISRIEILEKPRPKIEEIKKADAFGKWSKK
jgi:small nuclear ribonucleoprotein (snRNP)-like protein